MTRKPRKNINLDTYNEIFESFLHETDRGAAVLAGGFMDEFCRKYLRAFMIDDSDVEEIFGHYAPLSTFAGRIDCLYAFGHITTSERKDLQNIKKIRNDFAHHLDDLSFNVSSIRDICSKLSNAQHPEEYGHLEPKEQYIVAIQLLVAKMDNAIHQRSAEKDKEVQIES